MLCSFSNFEKQADYDKIAPIQTMEKENKEYQITQNSYHRLEKAALLEKRSRQLKEERKFAKAVTLEKGAWKQRKAYSRNWRLRTEAQDWEMKK